jgi:hypothetical protein
MKTAFFKSASATLAGLVLFYGAEVALVFLVVQLLKWQVNGIIVAAVFAAAVALIIKIFSR